VLEQHEATTRPQHALGLRDGRAVIGDRAERQGADDRVEALVGELERLGVADA